MSYPLLERINAPGEIKNLPASDMPALCEEIRQFLIKSVSETGGHLIQQAAQTIREKYNQPLSLNDLLRQAHMSRSYFLRLFRRYMGTTPYNYLISTRITQAKALLALTDRSLQAGQRGRPLPVR